MDNGHFDSWVAYVTEYMLHSLLTIGFAGYTDSGAPYKYTELADI